MLEGARIDPGVGAGMGQAGRLAEAKGLLRRLEARAADAHPVPEPGADGRILPVVPPLAGLLPGGGLRRGSTVAVAAGVGSTSLLLALLAQASAAGAWAAVVGRPELGLVAAAEMGMALERMALVPYPGADLVAVTAALLDGLDLVAVACSAERGCALRAADRQRLSARARQRGAVLLPLGPWPGADLELGCERGEWRGVVGGVGAPGCGRLRARRVEVRLRGRGIAPAGRHARLLLPGEGGLPAAVGAEVDVAGDAAGAAAALRDREAG